MSYCRWSSEGFQCDVYVYESAHGWEVHVAGSRRTERAPSYWWPDITKEEFKEAYAKYSEFMDNTKSLPIGLSRDCESYTYAEPGDAAFQLQSLKAEGYVIPDYAINALLEEQQELDDGLQG